MIFIACIELDTFIYKKTQVNQTMKNFLRCIVLLVAAAGTSSAFKYRPTSHITNAAINGAMWETAGRTYEYEPISSSNASSRKDKYSHDDGLPFEIRAAPPRGGEVSSDAATTFGRSTVLTLHSITAFVFSALFLLGSLGIDLPFGPAAIIKDFDIGTNVADVLLCRLCSAYLLGVGMFESRLADDERAQKVFNILHIFLSMCILLTKGSFASDAIYYMISAMIVGFTAAGLLVK